MVNSKVSSQPPIASYWPWHSRKKSKHGGLRIWNFKGYWKNRFWKFQGSTKKRVEFPGMTKKTSCGISMGLGLWSLEFSSGVTQFYGISRAEALFCLEVPRQKPQTYKFQRFFQKSMSSTPSCLDFFWNSTICTS